VCRLEGDLRSLSEKKNRMQQLDNLLCMYILILSLTRIPLPKSNVDVVDLGSTNTGKGHEYRYDTDMPACIKP